LKGRHLDDIDDIRSTTTAALKAIPQTISKIVLKGGLGAGIGAYLPKGSTWKATTVVFSSEICSTFIAMSSRTLLYDVVYLIQKAYREYEITWYLLVKAAFTRATVLSDKYLPATARQLDLNGAFETKHKWPGDSCCGRAVALSTTGWDTYMWLGHCRNTQT